MNFEKIECIYAFYDDYTGDVFYQFNTVPQIDHGEWAISRGGDTAYDTMCDFITQDEFPPELIELVEYIPEDIEIEGLEE